MIKIRETSPCDSCMFFTLEDSDIAWDNCPIYIDLEWDYIVPHDVWKRITQLTGCSCYKQKGFTFVNNDKDYPKLFTR